MMGGVEFQESVKRITVIMCGPDPGVGRMVGATKGTRNSFRKRGFT